MESTEQGYQAVLPQAEKWGGRPIGIQRMLRIHFLQHWFELSDPGAEEALYDSRAMRQFVGIDLGKEPLPDETTILNFRHLMERHNLSDIQPFLTVWCGNSAGSGCAIG